MNSKTLAAIGIILIAIVIIMITLWARMLHRANKSMEHDETDQFRQYQLSRERHLQQQRKFHKRKIKFRTSSSAQRTATIVPMAVSQQKHPIRRLFHLMESTTDHNKWILKLADNTATLSVTFYFNQSQHNISLHSRGPYAYKIDMLITPGVSIASNFRSEGSIMRTALEWAEWITRYNQTYDTPHAEHWLQLHTDLERLIAELNKYDNINKEDHKNENR